MSKELCFKVNSIDNDDRVPPQFPIEFWNHYDSILIDPEFPRMSNMVEGFHRGFKTRVHRPKPSVQDYFRAIREQQVMTDFHLDRLEAGITPVVLLYCLLISVRAIPASCSVFVVTILLMKAT